MDDREIKPKTRIETTSSSEAGTAGEEFWSKSGGHSAQEKVSHPDEPVKVANAYSKKTAESDAEAESSEQPNIE